MLDDLDRRLIRQLQFDPARPMAELAEAAHTTAAVASRRLARLRERGVIRGQEAVIDWRALGYTIEVSLRISLDKSRPVAFDDCIAAAREIPEVLEIQTFLGQVDLRLSLIARDMDHYQTLYKTRILTLPHITDIEALVLVARLKDAEALPL